VINKTACYKPVLPNLIHFITNASVTIPNVIYLFNINSRNIDGYYRRWIDYLNARFNVCILNRSIKLDNTCIEIVCSSIEPLSWLKDTR